MVIIYQQFFSNKATKNMPRDINIEGIPCGIEQAKAELFTTRINDAVNKLLINNGIEKLRIIISSPSNSVPANSDGKNDELSTEQRAKQYKSQQPLYNFEQLIVNSDLREDLLAAMAVIQAESIVFDKWGLNKIEPFPRTALNFHGKPGTGKTLAAHTIASKLNKPILVASYAQIESKFHGDGPKNVEALFYAATRDGAVLFIDEADSLLSKRLTDATQGSERAANSMCSQLLICLEKFRGVVVFATNLVENYDRAFETRVRHIHFPMPNEECRHQIWETHLPEELPRTADVSIDKLAKVEDVCGRDIKNAVIDAAVRVVCQGKEFVELKDLLTAIEHIKTARISAT